MERTVVVRRESEKSLGIGFRSLQVPPYCQVAKILENGTASNSALSEGDLLLSVNDIDVQNMGSEDVRHLLSGGQCAGEPVLTLRVYRTTMNGSSESSNAHDSMPPPQLAVTNVSPHTSPVPSRVRRTGMVKNMQDPRQSLPDVKEQHSLAAASFGPAEPHRHSYSMSPHSQRKQITLMGSRSVDFAKLPQWRTTGITQHIPLQNVLDGSELNDRLHSQAVKFKNTGCCPSHCKGSHLWPKEQRPSRPHGQPRTKEEVLPLAEDFIKQYYESKKSALGLQFEEQMQERLSAVRSEIEMKGHYQLTYEELVFGARTAWRNSPRCVNRIIWRQLEVLDAREARSPKDMFDAVCHHMKYGTNEGNLRSTITVFHHRTGYNSDFRVWNPQLIRYAGYKREDGSVLGDPSNVEFTDVCKKLGWTPPSTITEFDVLPLVLQAAGGEAQWFQVPPELVLEVAMRHPDYPKIEDLGLRWYALPAVSNMMLDVGGLEFTACPFNGWYMSSEIARDFVDVNRYNKLKDIAVAMDLDTQKMQLWKDKVFVELNTAILCSFQKSNVSIVDHHSATESFMTHIKAETKTRGGCPADWVWIVPPVSGSLTPVFHQEMLLYFLSPNYEYQDDPWKHYPWPKSALSGRHRERSSSIKFKTLVETVRSVSKMFSAFYQKRVKATVIYATETGRSRNYANMVKDIFDKSFASKVVCMEDYSHANLEQEQLLIVVTSTFGSGDPPANGEQFARFLLDLRNGTSAGQTRRAPRPHRLSSVAAPSLEMLEKARDSPLTQVKYAVFALGSRAYPSFCTFGHTCDNLLKELGAEQIYPCGEGDELCGQEESFQAWVRECYERACEIYKLDGALSEADICRAPVYSNESFRLVKYEGCRDDSDTCADLKCVHGKTVYAPVVKSRAKLQSHQSNRSTILVVIDTKGTPLQYQPGDHIAIYPHNNPRVVNELLESLNLPFDPDEPLIVESKRKSSSGNFIWQQEKRLPVPITLREAFTKYVDITTPPSPQFLKLLAQETVRATEQEALLELAKGGHEYEDWKFDLFPNIVDVLNQFHSLKVNVTLLLHHLPLLQCRYYSISSSPNLNSDEVHITVAVVAFRKKGGKGPKHYGVCSTWLNKIEPGTVVPSFIRKAPAFHMPEEPQVPIIMVGPGTGIAPFRSFWQERIHQRNESLKSQLKDRSNFPRFAPKPEPKPEDRRRRKTAFIRPDVKFLQQGSVSPAAQAPAPMRRSVSDTGDTSNLIDIVAARERAWGQMTLYFGCRRSDLDLIYKDELKKAHVMGALSDFNVALSREPGQPKTYVQHLLKRNADSIVHQLIEERGHFYVCGDISMAADVCRTLQNIFEDNAAMSASEARRLIESMKENGLYHEDIFGVTLKTAEVTTRVRTAAKKARRILAASDTPTTPFMRTLQFPDSPQLSKRLTPKPQRQSVPVDSPLRQRRQKEVTRSMSLVDSQTLGVSEAPPILGLLEPLAEQSSREPSCEPSSLSAVKEEESEQGTSEEQPSPVPISAVKEEKAQEVHMEVEEKKETEAATADTKVQLREMSSERKQVRRIRTRSKVETVI